MITRTYITKFNTIIKDSKVNTALNPIAELVYGTNLTRLLVYFDHTKLKQMVEDKTFPNISKLKHYLKITNAGSFDLTQLHQGETSSINTTTKLRTTSFDLIFFLIPKEWDGGKGFDYSQSFTNQGYYYSQSKQPMDSSKLLSTDASNWYQRKNGNPWEENGIYSTETLSREYDKYASLTEESNIVIGRQHFDIGNENINIDITDIVNKFITNDLENNGIGIAYAPNFERTTEDKENYVGFMTNHTNTFFEPFVETIYDDYIDDNRGNFILNKKNKLYLYANIGGEPTNLDELPTCSINDKQYEVKQYSKGIYYIEAFLKDDEYQPNTMLYDVWSNIKFQGENGDDVELEFVTKPKTNYFNISSSLQENHRLTPTLYGINYDEKIKRGDIRKLNLIARKNYSKTQAELINFAEIRVFIKDGTREVDVLPWMKINQTTLENYVLIDTNILIPQKYYVDVKINHNMEEIIHHDLLTFTIIDDLNNKYC